MTYRALPIAALSLVAMLVAPSAVAEDDMPAKTAKYRHVVMEGAGKHMKAGAMIVKGEVSRTSDMEFHARALLGVAESLEELFPKGTGPGDVEKTEALPKIWEDWEGFVKANEAFKKAAADLVKAAEKGKLEEIRPAFGAVGKSCGGCHDDFRKDED